MNTISMAFKNLRKNFSFYALYILSVSLVITVYFAFASFSRNNVMLEKISGDGRVESMCRVISVFLIAFVIFYMSYSNRFFLRRRTKELGIYALLGYRRERILSLLISENIITGIFALAMGLVLGAVMHKGIVFGTTVLLNLSVDNAKIPFFHFPAIADTIVFILGVLFVLALSNARFLFKTSLMDLVRFEKSAERRMKFRKIPALSGFILIIVGYGLALDIFRGNASLWFSVGFYPTGLMTALLIVAGTILFIAYFLPYAVQKSKRHKKTFYTETKIVTVPHFIYRIRSNAKTLIMLTLLSAATLTVSSVMALSLFYPIAAVARIAPSELEFRIEEEGQLNSVKLLISQYVPAGSVTYTQTDIFRVTASAENLPMEYSAGTSKGSADNENLLREEGFECISYSQYVSLLQAQRRNDIAGKQSVLQDDECILVKYQPNADGSDETGSIYSLNINGGSLPLTVKATTLSNPISFANSIGTMIVSDNVYEQIKSGTVLTNSIVSINGEGIRDNEKLFEDMSNLLDNSPYLQGHSHRVNEIMSAGSSTFLLIGFLVVLFFIATGSILYFNNISAVSDSKADYQILSKMGYSNKMRKKILRKQILTFFSIPFLFGLTDCIFATIVYKTGLMQDLLGNTITLYFPTIIAVALTAAIYFIYYFITVHTCYKTVLNA
ncbi:MAG: ABC transporter permease [Roseburia sp.]|jgi:putative ABC transport system permease protein|nr:ABC transporter permease [Roseburia sp.]